MGIDSEIGRIGSEVESVGTDSDWYPWGAKKYVYACLISLNICVQYDTGALAALMADDEEGLAHIFSLSTTEQGLLLSVAHLGVTLGCMVSGNALQKIYAKNLLLLSCVVNTLTAWLFALSPNFELLLISRILNGFSQSFLIVFAPIWTDEFAPKQYKTTWLSLSEAGGPLGIVVGYLVAGLLTENANVEWRVAFYIQASLLSILTLAFIPIRKEYLQVHEIPCDVMCSVDPNCGKLENINNSEKHASLGVETKDEVGVDEEGQTVVVLNSPSAHSMKCMIQQQSNLVNDSSQESPIESSSNLVLPSLIPTEVSTSAKTPNITTQPALSVRQIWWLVGTNSLVLCSTFALSSLYFVVTGLQMWITAYLTRHDSPIKANKNAVVAAFGFCAATAPIVGVVTGGIIIDKIGGYGNTRRTALLCSTYGVMAVVSSYSALAMKAFFPFIVCIWFLLFFGGAIIPGLMGIIVSAVQKSHRCVCLSFVKLVSTVLGFFGGPFAFGVVASFSGLIWGFRAVLGFSAVAELFLIITWLLCRKIEPVVDIAKDDPELVHRIRASVFATVQPSAMPSPTRRASHARLQRLNFSQISLNKVLKERSTSFQTGNTKPVDDSETNSFRIEPPGKVSDNDPPADTDPTSNSKTTSAAEGDNNELAVIDSTSDV